MNLPFIELSYRAPPPRRSEGFYFEFSDLFCGTAYASRRFIAAGTGFAGKAGRWLTPQLWDERELLRTLGLGPIHNTPWYF